MDDADAADAADAPPVSRNVYLMLVLCVIWGFADSVWSGTVLAAWVFLLSDESNSDVGYVEAAQGLASLITALPVGYVADKMGRQGVIRVGGLSFLAAAAATAWSVVNPHGDDDKQALLMLTGALCLWGLGGGIFSGPAQALFADSIPRGERSKWYMYLMICYLLPGICGPLASIAMFHYYGNDWSLEELKPVFLFGIACEVPAAGLAFLFKDSLALPEGEEEDGDEEGSGGAELGEAGAPKPEHLKEWRRGSNGGCVTVKMVPYVMFFSQLCIAIGSGMTIKFFPLFFKQQIDLSPIAVQSIFVVSPIVMAALSGAFQQLSKSVGRIQVMILTKVVGVSLICVMALLIHLEIHTWHYMIPIYILRTGFMNATYPLAESVLMDFVPKDTRARWKSLESIAAFGWCGSAALGGILADKYSYSFTFLITAALQGTGTLMMALLIPVVPIQEAEKKESEPKPAAKKHQRKQKVSFKGSDLKQSLVSGDDAGTIN